MNDFSDPGDLGFFDEPEFQHEPAWDAELEDIFNEIDEHFGDKDIPF